MREKYLRKKIDLIDKSPSCILKQSIPEPVSDSKEALQEYADKCLFRGRAYLVTDRPDDCIEFLGLALQTYTKIDEPHGLFFANLYSGISYREQALISESSTFLEVAYDIAYNLNKPTYILLAVMHMISQYSFTGMDGEATELYIKTKPMLEELNDDQFSADYLNNYGYFKITSCKYQEAKEILEKSLDHFKKHFGEEVGINRAIAYENYANACFNLKEYDLAEEYGLLALKHTKRLGLESVEASASNVLAQLYAECNDYAKAYEHLHNHTRLIKSLQSRYRLLEFSTCELKILRKQLESSRDLTIIKNAELKKKNIEQEKLLSDMKLINDLGAKLTSTYELANIYDIIYGSIFNWIQPDAIGIATCDDEKRQIEVRYLVENGELRMQEAFTINYDDPDSILSYVARNRKDLLVNDMREEYQSYIRTPVHHNHTKKRFCKQELEIMNRSYMISTMYKGDNLIGIMTIQNSNPNKYTEGDLEIFKSVSNYVSVAISNAINNSIIEEKARQLEQLSLLDPLTQLENRRSFNQYSEELDITKQAHSLIIADMNHLKRVNDNYGHMMGDQYLIEISEILNSVFSPARIFRLSGDEFAIITTSTNREQILNLIEQTKKLCSSKKIGRYPLSVAVGCAFSPIEKSQNDLFNQAETRMYIDKVDYYRRNSLTIR